MSIFSAQYLRLTAIMTALVLTLSGGCGGPSGTTVDPWVAPPAGYYKPLDSTENATSTLGGVGIRGNNSDNSQLEIARAVGSLDHNPNGALTYTDTDNSYTLTDPDGMSGLIASDGQEGQLLDESSAYNGTYEYVMPVEFTYTQNDVKYTTLGFAGIITDAAHIPVSGTATYTGDATGFVNGSTGSFVLTNGISNISINFAAGEVDLLTLNDFTATASGTPVTAPPDTIQITGMTIAGNTFSGGELVALLNDLPVDVTGANTTATSEGMFFGWDSANPIPDEVGGVILVEGDAGEMRFLFVGD